MTYISKIINLFQNRRTEIWDHSIATLAAVISRVSMLLITIINTQYLSPDEFGIFAILGLIANIIVAFVSCGGDMWLNRFCRPRHTLFAKAPIVTRFYLQISIGLASFVILCALSFATFGRHSFEEQGLTIAFCLLWAACTGLIEAILAILRTINKIHSFFVVRDLFMPLALMFSVVFFKIDSALEFFMISFVLWLGILCLLLHHILSHTNTYIPKSPWTWNILKKELSFYTISLIANNFTSRIANGFDTLILTRILPIDLVGRYRLVSHFSNALIVIQHFVFLTLPWHLRQNNIVAIGQPTKTVQFRQHLLLLSAFPVVLIFCLGAKPLLGILGESYKSIATPLSLLIMVRFSDLLWGPQHEKLISSNEVLTDTTANILAIVVGISLFFAALVFWEPIKSAVFGITVSAYLAQLRRFYFIKENFHGNQTNPFPWLPLIINSSVVASMFII